MNPLIYSEWGYKFVGANFGGYRGKGRAILTAVFQKCMALELGIHPFRFEMRKVLRRGSNGHPLKRRSIPDLVGYGKIIIELKAVLKLAERLAAQVSNYLNATVFKPARLVKRAFPSTRMGTDRSPAFV